MTMKEKIREIVDERNTAAGRIFDTVIQFLIFFSLIGFSVETLPDLSPEYLNLLHLFEAVTVVVFTIEYITRVAVAKRPVRFVFSFFGIVDLLAILPYYLATGIDLRAVRLFRVLRIIRFLKLPRYDRAIRRIRIAFRIAREDFIMFSAVAFIVFYVAAVGIYYFEHEAQPDAYSSIFHSMWWSVVTLTTVGYGDMYPVTLGGRIFTFFVLMLGLGVVAVPAGIFASALSEARQRMLDDDNETAE